jgi:hypothetical protein
VSEVGPVRRTGTCNQRLKVALSKRDRQPNPGRGFNLFFLGGLGKTEDFLRQFGEHSRQKSFDVFKAAVYLSKLPIHAFAESLHAIVECFKASDKKRLILQQVRHRLLQNGGRFFEPVVVLLAFHGHSAA